MLISQSRKLSKTFHLHNYSWSMPEALKHPWKRSGYAWSCFYICKKKVHFVNLSFSLSGLTHDFLDHSPWFEYKSTLFWSLHICGTPVLCYDSYLIVGVYSAFCEWGVSDSPFCSIMRMLILHVLPWCRATASICDRVCMHEWRWGTSKTKKIFCLANES